MPVSRPEDGAELGRVVAEGTPSFCIRRGKSRTSRPGKRRPGRETRTTGCGLRRNAATDVSGLAKIGANLGTAAEAGTCDPVPGLILRVVEIRQRGSVPCVGAGLLSP